MSVTFLDDMGHDVEHAYEKRVLNVYTLRDTEGNKLDFALAWDDEASEPVEVSLSFSHHSDTSKSEVFAQASTDADKSTQDKFVDFIKKCKGLVLPAEEKAKTLDKGKRVRCIGFKAKSNPGEEGKIFWQGKAKTEPGKFRYGVDFPGGRRVFFDSSEIELVDWTEYLPKDFVTVCVKCNRLNFPVKFLKKGLCPQCQDTTSP